MVKANMKLDLINYLNKNSIDCVHLFNINTGGGKRSKYPGELGIVMNGFQFSRQIRNVMHIQTGHMLHHSF